jgi:hypothetical protein
MNYWLCKSEPYVFSWDDHVKKDIEGWSGVRNYAARNNLRAMKLGDLSFFYHSNQGVEIVGIMEVVKEAYPDPTDETGRFNQGHTGTCQYGAYPPVAFVRQSGHQDRMGQNYRHVQQLSLAFL